MKPMTREKAALGVFTFLILGGLAVAVAYIVTIGHSLNVAASSIDDATGSLDGYTALLYEGTAVKRTETVVDSSSAADRLSSRALTRLSVRQGDDGGEDEVGASEAPGSAQETGEGAGSPTVFTLMCSYLESNANVIEVDVADDGAYSERTLVRSGDALYGFLSIDEVTAQPHYLAKRVEEYRSLGVDVVVCVTDGISLLGSYPGVDAVISRTSEGLSSHGVYDEGVFYDDAPLVGKVGVMLISPSRTITAKDVVSL